MGKRVSNKRGTHAGSRSGRVRLGYHRMRKIANLSRAMEKYNLEHSFGAAVGREAKEAYAALSSALMKLMPKRVERRGIR